MAEIWACGDVCGIPVIGFIVHRWQPAGRRGGKDWLAGILNNGASLVSGGYVISSCAGRDEAIRAN